MPFVIIQVNEMEGISRYLLLSTVRLLSRLKKNSQPFFGIVWSIMSRISLNCSDIQVCQAHEEFEQMFPACQIDVEHEDEDPRTEQ